MCRGSAVALLEKGCKDMGEDDQRRLAVFLANCQLGASGLPTYKCTHDMSVKQCTKGMSDQAWNSYTSMLTHTASLCYYLESNQFASKAEELVNSLYRNSEHTLTTLTVLGNGIGATLRSQQDLVDAQGHLTEGFTALADSHARLEALSAAGLQHHEQLLEGQGALLSSAASTASALAGVAAQTTTIEAGVAQSLLLERELLERQLEANASLARLAEAQRDAAVRTLAYLQELESGAESIAAAQRSFGAVQTQLAASSAAVAERQERLSLTLDGFATTVKGLSAWQERSARGIGLLLGSRWGVDDVVWALASGGAAVWVTGSEPFSGARLWILAALCAGGAAERAVVDRIVAGPRDGNQLGDSMFAILRRLGAIGDPAAAADAAHVTLLSDAVTVSEAKRALRALSVLASAAITGASYLSFARQKRLRDAAAKAALKSTLDESLQRFEARFAQAVADRIRADLGLGGFSPGPGGGSGPLLALPPPGAGGSPPHHYQVEFVPASEVALRIAARRANSGGPAAADQRAAMSPPPLQQQHSVTAHRGGIYPGAVGSGATAAAGPGGSPDVLAAPIMWGGAAGGGGSEGAWWSGQAQREAYVRGGDAEAAARQADTGSAEHERKRGRDSGGSGGEATAPAESTGGGDGGEAAAQKRTRGAAAAASQLPPLPENRAAASSALHVHHFDPSSTAIVDCPAAAAEPSAPGGRGRAGKAAAAGGIKRRRSVAALAETDTQSEQSAQLAPAKRRELGGAGASSSGRPSTGAGGRGGGATG